VRRGEIDPRRDEADARGIDEDLVAAPAADHLGVARDHVHAGAGGGPSDRLDHALEIRDRQALLEMNASER